MALTITKAESTLNKIVSSLSHVYYKASAIENSETAISSVDMELPVLEDTITFNTGDTEVTEKNLVDGTIWTSKATKGDSDISFQIACVSQDVMNLFMTKSTNNYKIATATKASQAGVGYGLDVKKATGSLVFGDDTGEQYIILPNVEMYGTLVAGDSDNPAYINVKVTPKANTSGDSLIVV